MFSVVLHDTTWQQCTELAGITVSDVRSRDNNTNYIITYTAEHMFTQITFEDIT